MQRWTRVPESFHVCGPKFMDFAFEFPHSYVPVWHIICILALPRSCFAFLQWGWSPCGGSFSWSLVSSKRRHLGVLPVRGGGEHHPWPLAGGQSCVTQCIWGREHCVSSSLSRNTKISIHILSCSAFPHSWIKFAFPGASVPEIPGTWERRHAGARELGSAGTQENKTRNACPSLQRWCSV